MPKPRTIVGTSACLWCGEPVNLYLGNIGNGKYTRYCSSRVRSCKHINTVIKNRYNGKRKEYRDRWKYTNYLKLEALATQDKLQKEREGVIVK